jgi:hypothetical protein
MRVLCRSLLACVLAAVPLWGQVGGRVSGSVIDPNGALVPSATVELTLQGGTTAVLRTLTTSAGVYQFADVRPDSYDLVVRAAGFAPYTLKSVKIDPAAETSLASIPLTVQPLTTRVDVSAPLQSIQTSNTEVATTITATQVAQLPALDRNVLPLIQTQAGVNVSGSAISINGLRTSGANVTLDGVNIQDNFIRENALTFTPNLVALGQISEFTLATSNAGAAMGGGAAHVSLVTPSGGNAFHGSAYFYNRNNALNANSWFNNKDGVRKSDFNQNQIGGSLGGPLRRDRLFFYGNYEAFRFGTDVSTNRTILTENAGNGIFTYVDQVSLQPRQVNVLQTAGVLADPAMEELKSRIPAASQINNFRVGDSSESVLRNTAGYSFTARGHHNRDNATARLDYVLSPASSISGTFIWNRQDVTRSDQSNDYSQVPKVRNLDNRKFLSAAWRWSPLASLTNEVRGGFNLAPITFDTSEQFGERILSGMVYSNPVNVFRAEGRNTDTFAFADNVAFIRGRHLLQFGFQSQHIRVDTWNDGGITPTYFIGMGLGNPSLTSAQVPNASFADVTAANNLLATLAGFVTGYSQTFNVASRGTGFVSGAGAARQLHLSTYALYVQDSWKLNSRLNLIGGLRYELPGVVDESDSLALLPVVQNGDPVATLLSNSTLDFAGASAGRPWYRRDKNNFAPNAGLAWDVFGDGTTSFRAAYGISYVNDETIQAIYNNVSYNEGLRSVSSAANLSSRVSLNLPAVPVPSLTIPRTFATNFSQNVFTAFGMPAPDLSTPYVQEWSVGVQRRIFGAIVEVRYVGNHATKLFRGFDLNPEIIVGNGFLDDFKRARQNGNLAMAASGVFNPAYNSSIAGSQPLTVFPLLTSGGLLTNSFVRNLIYTGQAGELAVQYVLAGLSGSVQFHRNPVSLASILLDNHSNSTYNALQIDMQRRFRDGLQFQANYTFGKVLSDTDGTASHRFEEFRDPSNGKVDRARPAFDVTHAFKGNAVYDLPIARNPMFLGGYLGGWSLSGVFRMQSGSPFSVLAKRGTLIRSQRSAQNTASSALRKSQLDELLQFRMTDRGPYIADASIIAADGRGVSTDENIPFSGQAFINPSPGELGSLQRRWFSGPWNVNFDLGLMKRTTIREGQSLELRMEALNVLNHPTWVVDDQDINSTSFGRIQRTANSPRTIQLSAHYRF